MARSPISEGAVQAPSIFISYRREDSAPYAGRICDYLTAIFGDDRVFMDVEGIQPGQNFAEAIERTVSKCTVMLVVIGPRWAEMLTNRAAQTQQDYVRHEIATALARKTSVVPVLVGGAATSELGGLSQDLSDLPFHQAIELRDASFKEDCNRLAKSLGEAPIKPKPSLFRRPVIWAAGAGLLAVLVFLALTLAGIGPWHDYLERRARLGQLVNTAQAQIKQGEYESSFKTYQDALKLAPTDTATLDGQVDAAMLWIENFHVLTPEGKNAEDIAAPLLAQLMPVLDGGLARTNGKDSRAADITAHLGWAHWLNEKIALKEFGGCERFFRQALAIDPKNVYANAMLGNWLLQTNGELAEAEKCFATALATGKERPLVREMQLGGLWGQYSDLEVRGPLFRALNEMRVNHEPLGSYYIARFTSYYEPVVNSQKELNATLTAVSPEDSWQTFLWFLKQSHRDAEEGRTLSEYIYANILEISGKRSEALQAFEALQKETQANHISEHSSMAQRIAASIKRLSPP